MRIEPSGVVMTGECELQLAGCTAAQPAPVTAIWTTPGRRQLNVCRSCFNEMVRSGEWEVQGAKIERAADVAVLDKNRSPLVVVEVKKRPDVMTVKGIDGWARRIHRNLVVHGGIPPRAMFLLAIFPGPIYAWMPDSTGPDAEPSEVIQVDNDMYPELKSFQQDTGDSDTQAAHAAYETAIADWLRRLQSRPGEITQNGQSAATVGLIANALSRGTIECEVNLPY
jgi:hypothetical protein